MTKKRGNIEVEETFLRSVALPEATDTYTVIAHGTIIDKVRTELKKNGFNITGEKYIASVDGEMALGKVYIQCDKDPDMGMIFTWWNSYNKRIKFGCAVGSFIYDNRASLIGSEGMSWIRKHTGTADQEADTIMEQLIAAADSYFDKIIAEKNKMKDMPLSVEDYGCIMGALYFEHELVTPTQASAVIQERKKPTHTYTDRDTLWGLYKLLMFGIEGMDITKWVKSQQKLHHMIMTEYLVIQENKVQELADAMVEPLKSNNELPLSNISGDLAEKNESFQWNVKETEIQEMEGPGIEDEPQISGIPNGNTMSDTDDEELTEDELASQLYGVDNNNEVVRDLDAEEDEPIMFENKEAFVDQAIKQFQKDRPLVEYYADNHFDANKTAKENMDGFAAYTQYMLKQYTEVVPEAQGTPKAPGQLRKTDPPTSEDIAKDSEEANQALAELAEETDKKAEENEDPFADDPFAGEIEEVTAEDLAAKHGIEIPAKLMSEEQIDAVKEEHRKQDVSSLFEEDAKIEITGTTKSILDSLDEPVEILTPEESKEKGSENFVFPTDLDNPDKLQQSLEVPDEVREQAEAVEARMKELYGSIRPYHIDGNLVTIDETHECFSI